MKAKNYFWLILFVASVAFGAKITDNILNVGDGNPATDKQINMSDGQIKWDSATSKIQFSNDAGSSFKDIGSGGGGGASGVNLLGADDNADFEGTSVSPWAASGGTFIINSGTPGFDLQSGSWDSDGAAQTLDSALKPVALGLENRSCNSTIQYKWVGGVATDLKYQVLDSGNSVIAEKDLDPSSDWRKDALQFTCPSSESIKIRILSVGADPALLLIDNATLGKSDFVDISQTEVYGTATTPFTGGCFWTKTGATLSSFTAVPACPVPTVTGNASAPAAKVPAIVFDNLPAGKYEVKVNGTFIAAGSTSGNQSCGYAITDGTDTKGLVSVFSDINQGSGTGNTTSAIFEYSSNQTNVQFEVFGSRTGGNANCHISADVDQARALEITVIKYPASSAEAVTLETTGWHVDVNIGGGNPNLGLSSQASYVAITDASLDMVINQGSQPARIPCSGGEDAAGLTCSVGSERVGVDFDIPTAGRYKVCATFNHLVGTATSGNILTTFQLVETPNTAETITQEGEARQPSGFQQNSANNVNHTYPHKLCSDFEFSNVGKKTIRLMYEQSVTGTMNANLIFADRDGNTGQRDIHITVEKMDQQFPTPVFTELQNSLDERLKIVDGSAKKRILDVRVNNTGSVCQTTQGGEGVASYIRPGTGECNLTFDAGVFTEAPMCTCMSASTTSNIDCTVNTTVTRSATSMGFRTQVSNTHTNIDGEMYILCVGKY